MSYEEIGRLLNKYSTKQPGERWSSRTENRKNKIIDIKRKIELFEGINSEYFRLKGSQVDRAKYLIKKLNFHEVNSKCSSEQIIVLICYFVNCEYNRRYSSKWCKKVFKDYKISTYIIERFLIYMAEYGIKNTILEKTVSTAIPLYNKKRVIE